MIFQRFFVLAVLALSLVLPAAALQETGRVLLPFGDDSHAIGIMPLDKGFWAPPFFAVQADGSLVIPDFYHQRLIRYSAKGEWQANLPCPSLTPRLRSFTWNQTSGHFLMLNDQTVSVVDRNGQELALTNFGLTIPDYLWITDSQVFVAVTNNGRRYTLSFDHNLGASSELSLKAFGQSIPVFRDNQRRFFAFNWADYQQLGKKIPDLPANAWLAQTDSTGRTLWSHTSDRGSQDFWLVDAAGTLQKHDSLSLPKQHQADGFATVVSDDLQTIYKAVFSDKGMTIVAFGW